MGTVMRGPRQQPADAGGVSLSRPGSQPGSVLMLLAALLLNLTVPCAEVSAQPAKPSQSEVQAVYLFDFAKFVRWPAELPAGSLDICIAGQPAYVDSLKKIVAGESIDGHPLGVRLLQHPGDEAGCDVLFIGAAAKERLDSLIAATASKPVLTVSDIPGFLDRGGMIQFVLIENRVRFSVDLGPVTRGGISLSSELLKVAVHVKPSGGGAP